MSYLAGWRPIAGRISGLAAAGNLHAALSKDDSYGGGVSLRQQCARVIAIMERFQQMHGVSLPPDASLCLDEAINKIRPLTNESDRSSLAAIREAVAASLVMLTAFEAEMTFLLTDVQADIRSRSERAFEHLQRSIVADPTFGNRWKSAFDAGETACEKLGGAHFLLHGIWAFKANAEGGRTDLVYQEPIDDLSTARRWADGLVLTEWKLAKPDAKADDMFGDARRQAGLYSKGILAGFELASTRYAVVVTERRVPTPSDIVTDGVTYRHINIAVDPKTPSKDSIQ